MTWQRYNLVFRLVSPLHIGYRKMGNLMQTRGYLPGKNLWAALTARLTRDDDNGAESQRYVEIGEAVQNQFRFTYFYPAIQNNDNFDIHYPWEDDHFDYLFLDSYASTALNYTSQSAEDAMLHEIEFIAPHTRCGQAVYLKGALYVKPDLSARLDKWKAALARLQLGGERGYGWGQVQVELCHKVGEPFNTPRGDIHNNRITAHLKAENVSNVHGPIEPLIGWERNNDKNRTTNWKLSQKAIICYMPGAEVTTQNQRFTIGQDGRWE